MTPLEIEMLFHFDHRCGPYDDRNGIAQRQALAWFLAEGLVEPGGCATIYGAPYTATKRGRAMVAKLTSTALPVETWT